MEWLDRKEMRQRLRNINKDARRRPSTNLDPPSAQLSATGPANSRGEKHRRHVMQLTESGRTPTAIRR
jgi:hypothetical protein